MDTTPLSKAVIFRSPQQSGMGAPSFPQGHCSLKQRCPAKSPVFTSPPGDQKTALLASVAVSTNLSLTDSGVTSTPVGKPSTNCNSACNCEAMDTTSPSQASIFCSSPEPRDNHFPLNMVLSGSDNTPPMAALWWPMILSIYLKSHPLDRPQFATTLTQESPLSLQLGIIMGSSLTILT